MHINFHNLQVTLDENPDTHNKTQFQQNLKNEEKTEDNTQNLPNGSDVNNHTLQITNHSQPLHQASSITLLEEENSKLKEKLASLQHNHASEMKEVLTSLIFEEVFL